MTRVNVVPPAELCNQHLSAEWREMPRVVSSLKKSLNRKNKPFSLSEIPPTYRLGPGHVKFFFDKFKFLHNRHTEITEELKKRGFKVGKQCSKIFASVGEEWYGDYVPTKEAKNINRKRIEENMPVVPRYKVGEKNGA